MHDSLARTILHQLRFGVTQIEGLAEQFDGFAKTGRRLGFHERTEFGGDLVHGTRPHAHGHAFPGTHRVDGQRERRDFAVDGRLLEQQRLAAAGRFHLAVGDFGDFEFGGDGLRDAFEFAGAVEVPDKIAEGFKSHTRARLAQNDPAGNAADLPAEFADERRQSKYFCEHLRHRRVKSHFGSKSATNERSSFNSFTVASILPRLKSLTGTPWTISSFWPLLRTGNEQIRFFSMP